MLWYQECRILQVFVIIIYINIIQCWYKTVIIKTITITTTTVVKFVC